MGVFQQTGSEGIVKRSIRVTQHIGQKAADRIDDHQGWQLASGQNIITGRDFICHQVLADALVNTFIPPTKECNLWQVAQFASDGLVECSALRCHQNERAGWREARMASTALKIWAHISSPFHRRRHKGYHPWCDACLPPIGEYHTHPPVSGSFGSLFAEWTIANKGGKSEAGE